MGQARRGNRYQWRIDPHQFQETVAMEDTVVMPLGPVVVGAQGSANASSIFEVNSTSQGVLLPRMTTAQMNAISSPATGLVIYNTSTSDYYFWNGSAWGIFGNSIGNHNTLDEAYDEGGAGSGRTITADAGAVQITGNFRSDNSTFSLVNDTLSLLAFDLPISGSGIQLGAGIMTNALGDFSSIGGFNREIRIGYSSATGSNRVIIDTTNIRFLTPEWFQVNADSTVGLYADDDVYLLVNNGDGWDIGYTAFSSTGTGTNKSFATMYALREDLQMDVEVVLVDTTSIQLSSFYSINDVDNNAYNRVKLDSTQISLEFGQTNGTPISSPNAHTFSMTTNAAAISSTTAFFYAPRMTSTQASAITPQDGAEVYVTDTNGTFTQVGKWCYVNGSWTALH